MELYQFAYGLFFFLTGSLILTAIVSPETFEVLISKLDIINFNSTSNLDVIQNPKNYVNKKLTLRNVDLCFNNKIIDFKPDGNEVYLDYFYPDDLNAYYRFDLTGNVEAMDGSGERKYIFKIDEAVRKEYVRDLSGGSYFDCFTN